MMTLEIAAVLVVVYLMFSLSGLFFRIDPVWYAGLNKPAWTPPASIIGMVWAILYGLIALCFAIVWQETTRLTNASALWIAFLIFNYLVNQAFTYFLFTRKQLLAAFVDCLLVAVSAFFLSLLTKEYSTLAACLLLPYLIWSSFASYLSWSIYVRNRNKNT